MGKKILGFIGVPCYDIIIHSARILLNSGAKILLVDNSSDNSLVLCVPGWDSTSGSITEYKGLDYTSNQPLVKGIVDKYDYILIYFGNNITDKSVTVCTEIHFCITMDRSSFEFISSVSFKDRQVLNIIVLDYVNSRIKPRSIMETIGINFSSYSVIKHNINDIKLKYALQWEHLYSLRKLSDDLKSVISGIVSNCLNNVQDFNNYYKKSLKEG